MGRNFAYSEEAVNGVLRHCRSEPSGNPCYQGAMLLRIRELRDARKLTQQQLADLAGMSLSYLNEMENGKKQANQRRLEAIAAALGVRVIDLLRDASNPDAVDSHMETYRKLSPEDQAAVHRHAASLLAQKEAG